MVCEVENERSELKIMKKESGLKEAAIVVLSFRFHFLLQSVGLCRGFFWRLFCGNQN